LVSEGQAHFSDGFLDKKGPSTLQGRGWLIGGSFAMGQPFFMDLMR
jgi:hypothetical protein